MSVFCLIHSSGQGPHGWKLLADHLEKDGHHVIIPAFRVSETDKSAAWHGRIPGGRASPQRPPSVRSCLCRSLGGWNVSSLDCRNVATAANGFSGCAYSTPGP